MDIRKAFGADPSETEGYEFHLDGEAYVTLARAGGANVKFEKAMQRGLAPYKRAMAAGTLDEDTAVRVHQEAYADAVILGWRGIELDGESLPFTRENALRLFREFPEFWKTIRDEADKRTNFRHEEVAELGKASVTH